MVSSQSERNAFPSNKPSAEADNGIKRDSPNDREKDMGRLKSDSPSPVMNEPLKMPSTILALQNTDKPLAEKMRPNTLEEYFGQNKVVGEHTLLRSLLDSQEIPSLILWGPPGCGKVQNGLTDWCAYILAFEIISRQKTIRLNQNVIMSIDFDILKPFIHSELAILLYCIVISKSQFDLRDYKVLILPVSIWHAPFAPTLEIGRASCRERV